MFRSTRWLKVVASFVFTGMLMLGVGSGLRSARGAPSSVTSVPCTTTDLINALSTVVISGGAQTLDLTASCTYTLTVVNNGSGVDTNGLPLITNSLKLTLNGHGATIVRNNAAPRFRLFQINSNAAVTLSNLTLRNGFTPDGPFQDPGGSGGDGGAIYNAGKLIINSTTIYSNATGKGEVSATPGGPGGNGGKGSGIFSSGILTVTGSIFTANTTGLGGDAYFSGTHGTRGSGGGIYSNHWLYVTGTLFTLNSGGVGGGVENFGGNAKLIGNTFDSNTGDVGGGISNYNSGTMSVTNTIVLSNTALNEGGGVWSDGAITIVGSTIARNAAPAGGGFYFETGSFALINTPFLSNTATQDGGGLYAHGTVALSSQLFRNNRAGRDGGGLYADAFAITGSIFISNAAGSQGGGLYAAIGPGTIENSEIRANQAISNGGGVYALIPVFQPLQLTNTLFISNSSGGSGGGAMWGGAVYMTNSQFLTNTATTSGGGIWVGGAATVNTSRFTKNQAFTGGGIYARNPITVTRTHFIGNAAIGNALGLFVDGGPARIVNSVFRGTGAGVETIFITATNTSSQILFSTFTSISGTNTIGIYVRKGTVGITNTIVSSFTYGIYSNGGSTYENYNLFWNDSITKTSTTGGANDVSGDPRFVNPGLEDYHIRDGSAALNAGTSAGISIDIDGEARPSSGGFDIGYDEHIVYYLLYLPLTLKNF
jgi:predicted outer membrane repeat protein